MIAGRSALDNAINDLVHPTKLVMSPADVYHASNIYYSLLASVVARVTVSFPVNVKFPRFYRVHGTSIVRPRLYTPSGKVLFRDRSKKLQRGEALRGIACDISDDLEYDPPSLMNRAVLSPFQPLSVRGSTIIRINTLAGASASFAARECSNSRPAEG